MIPTEKTRVVQEGPFSIWIQKGIPTDIVAFLKTVTFGTEGAVYAHLGTEDRIAHMPDPFLCWATKADELVACMVMNQTQTLVGDKMMDTYYIRYFSAHPKYQGQGLTKRMSGLFIEQFKKILPQPALVYAGLEGGNKRSTTIVERVGFRHLVDLKTIGFSRFFPKKSQRIERLTDAVERVELLNKLNEFYSSHILYHTHHIFEKENYFVIREGGAIVAGLQMHKAVWKIKSMPGFTGFLLLNVVPRLPVLNKMMNPKWFEFLTFEGIYYQEGREDALFELIEGLLAREKLKTAILWLSEGCPVERLMQTKARLGLMNLFVKDSKVFLANDPYYLGEADQLALESHPAYISTFDFI